MKDRGEELKHEEQSHSGEQRGAKGQEQPQTAEQCLITINERNGKAADAMNMSNRSSSPKHHTG